MEFGAKRTGIPFPRLDSLDGLIIVSYREALAGSPFQQGLWLVSGGVAKNQLRQMLVIIRDDAFQR